MCSARLWAAALVAALGAALLAYFHCKTRRTSMPPKAKKDEEKPDVDETTDAAPETDGAAEADRQADAPEDPYLVALEREAAGYERAGREDRLKDVKAEIARVRGASGKQTR